MKIPFSTTTKRVREKKALFSFPSERKEQAPRTTKRVREKKALFSFPSERSEKTLLTTKRREEKRSVPASFFKQAKGAKASFFTKRNEKKEIKVSFLGHRGGTLFSIAFFKFLLGFFVIILASFAIIGIVD